MWLVDFILHIGDHLQELVKNYGNWIYAILFAIVFCETGLVVLPFLPGDSMLFAAGTIAAVGDMNIFVLIGLLIVAAILGDFVNFEIGKHFGQKLFSNPNSKIFKQSYLQQTHDYYEKYGGRTIIIARFIPIVRTFAPFVGGMGNMNYAQFARYNIVGAVLWVVSFTTLGYFFGQLPFVKEHFSWIMIAIIVFSVVPMIVEIIRHRKDK
ncbi:DedA family protein [Moraxella osloensis]|uniref:DedA family protein n=1 Tax=Faucicola osloensis TaxID=34062 RepID=A0A2I1RI43_FAUOS|nr:DedA family protein [Moraxella osloensis]MCK6052891.1 DedA family protein [Moraxella osloensis]PKZ68807.1 DedA family protein [Moraxella osloensis]